MEHGQLEKTHTQYAVQIACHELSSSSIIIPPLPCSFAWHNHPNHLQLKEMSDAWLLSRFVNFPGAASARGAFKADLLIKSGFHLFATLHYANGMAHRVAPIIKFIAWFFLCDTIFDDPAEMGCDLAAADQLRASIVSVLKNQCHDNEESKDGANASPCSDSNSMIIRVLRDTAIEWWDEIRKEMPITQQTRFIEKFMQYLDGTQQQIPYRCDGIVPDLETFKLIRTDAGGWQVCCVLIEYSLGLNFDGETLSHPLIRALQSSAAYNIYWVNDIFSFKKEFLEGDLLNVVAILYIQKLQQFRANKNSSFTSTTSKSQSNMQDIVMEVGI